jgi:hypothetical protein
VLWGPDVRSTGRPAGSPHVDDGGGDQQGDEQLRLDQRGRAVVGHAGCRTARPVVTVSATPASSSAAAITIHATS